MIYDAEPARPIDYSGDSGWWLGYLSAIVAAYLRGRVDEAALLGTLAAFIASPACGEELRRLLLDDE